VLNEINFFNTNYEPYVVLLTEISKKRKFMSGGGDGFAGGHKCKVSMENYDQLRFEETEEELTMRKDVLLEDIIPALQRHALELGKETAIVNSTILFGVYCAGSVKLLSANMRENLGLAQRFAHPEYQAFLEKLVSGIRT
jgi:hypothetical protein